MSFRFKVSDLSVGYDGKALIDNVSFEIGPGECILLCGANGIGKSTLLRTVAGQEKPLSGSAGFDEPAHKAILIPARVPKVQGFTVMQFVEASCFRRADWLGRVPASLESRICGILEKMGIGALSGRDISTLSDGEFQKAVIASALAQDAELVLLDEPTAFLDVDSRIEILSLLRDVAGDKSVIFSSHDIHEAARYCTRVFGVSRLNVGCTRTAENDQKGEGRGISENGGCRDVSGGAMDNRSAKFIDSGADAGLDAVKSVIAQCFKQLL